MGTFLRSHFFIILILLLGIFFRIYSLHYVPAGLTSDEANTGYDAYSLLKTGRDQWGQSFPLTSFKGFGDYRLPVYTYLVVPSISFFGLSSFAVKFPSAVFGCLSILLIYILVRRLFSERVGLLSALLLAISPWAVGLSRQGIESNVAITMYLAGLILFFHFFSKKNKDFMLLVASTVLFGICVYTYTSYLVFVPLSITALFLFKKEYFLLNRKMLLILCVILGILLFPYILRSSTGRVRYSQVGFTNNINSIGLIDVLNEERGTCQSMFYNKLCVLIDNKVVLFTSQFFYNYIQHFSPELLYINGSSGQYSILPERGFEYSFEIIFLLYGVYACLFLLKKYGKLLLILFLLSPIPDALTGGGHYSRSSIMQPFLIMVEGIGLSHIFGILRNIRYPILKFASYGLLSFLFIFSAIMFFITYLSYFKIHYSSYYQYEYKELMVDVYAKQHQYKKIFISRYLNDTQQYIFYLFYNAYDPKKFQSKKNIDYAMDSNGWVDVRKIDTIYFTPNNFLPGFSKQKQADKILLVGNPKAFAPTVKPIKVIRDESGAIQFQEAKYQDVIKSIQNL